MRITVKTNTEIGYGYKEYSSEGSIAITRKLGQIEDIEDKLHIEIITLFNALNKFQPIYVFNEYDGKIVKLPVYGARRRLVDNQIFIDTSNCYAVLDLVDYGNKWALSYKELEHKIL